MFKNTISVKIGWGHCDPAKIVFYPNYFIWFDQSTHLLFEKVGVYMDDLMKKFGVIGLPIVDAHAEFLSPSKYGDEIEVTSWISEWRVKSLITSHEIHNKGILAVKGAEVRVWAKPDPNDPNKIKTDIIPDVVKNYFKD